METSERLLRTVPTTEQERSVPIDSAASQDTTYPTGRASVVHVAQPSVAGLVHGMRAV